MEIISINYERRELKSEPEPHRSIQIECDPLRSDVDEEKFIEDLEATGYVDKPKLGVVSNQGYVYVPCSC